MVVVVDLKRRCEAAEEQVTMTLVGVDGYEVVDSGWGGVQLPRKNDTDQMHESQNAYARCL